jgi:hypothetical protein
MVKLKPQLVIAPLASVDRVAEKPAGKFEVSYVLTPSVKLNAVVVTVVGGRFAGRAFARVKDPETKEEVV